MTNNKFNVGDTVIEDVCYSAYWRKRGVRTRTGRIVEVLRMPKPQETDYLVEFREGREVLAEGKLS